MKKLILASAVAALSITAAQAAPQIYGKAFITLDVQDGDDASPSKDSRTQLNSIASRIGFKGGEALTQNTDLVYQLEYRLDVDSERPGDRNFEARDTYLGLANKQYGTLVAGRLTAIDDYIDYANVTKGGVVGGDNVLASVNGPRANNAFAYFSPERNGLQFMGMYALDEMKGNDSRVRNDSLNGDAYGVGVKYEPTNAPYKVGATYLGANNAAAGDKLSAIRVSGAYAISPALTAGALYQNTDFSSDDNENALTLSAKYKVAQTPWTTYGQLDFVDNVGGTKNAEAQRIAVGGEYAFNKATTGHIYGAFLQSENAAGQDADSYGIGGGIEYKF